MWGLVPCGRLLAALTNIPVPMSILPVWRTKNCPQWQMPPLPIAFAPFTIPKRLNFKGFGVSKPKKTTQWDCTGTPNGPVEEKSFWTDFRPIVGATRSPKHPPKCSTNGRPASKNGLLRCIRAVLRGGAKGGHHHGWGLARENVPWEQ